MMTIDLQECESLDAFNMFLNLNITMLIAFMDLFQIGPYIRYIISVRLQHPHQYF